MNYPLRESRRAGASGGEASPKSPPEIHLGIRRAPDIRFNIKMARSDLLLSLVRAGMRGDKSLFRQAVEALAAEERQKRHTVFAEQLTASLSINDYSTRMPPNTQASKLNGKDNPLFYEIEPRRRLESLFLPELVETACREVIEEHHRMDILRSYGLEPRNRLLFVGPPGNGKTTLAEAIAEALALPLIVPRYEGLIGSYLGETAARTARLMEYVRSRSCVLFFDEFDTLSKERGDHHETGEIKRVVSSLLLQLDQLPTHVVLIAATNHAELLDRAVWRRFQIRMELPPPTRELRLRWLTCFAERNRIDWGMSPARLADRLKTESFSELEQFSLDVLRRHVLSLPDDNPAAIVSERIKQWVHRRRVKENAVE